VSRAIYSHSPAGVHAVRERVYTIRSRHAMHLWRDSFDEMPWFHPSPPLQAANGHRLAAVGEQVLEQELRRPEDARGLAVDLG
jgi:hypothetical protein